MRNSNIFIESSNSSIKSVNNEPIDFSEHKSKYDGKTLTLDSNVNGVISSSKIKNDTLMKILNQNNNKLNLESRLKKLTKKRRRKNKKKSRKNKKKSRKNKKKSNKRKNKRR